MRAFKNMEVVLVLGFAAMCAGFAIAPMPPAAEHGAPAAAAPARPAGAPVQVAPTIPDFVPQQMPVVHIIGHRPSADERLRDADAWEG